MELFEEKILEYLQSCSDFWSTKLDYNAVKCYFAGRLRFSVELEDGDYYISGQDIPLDIAHGVAVALEATS